MRAHCCLGTVIRTIRVVLFLPKHCNGIATDIRGSSSDQGICSGRGTCSRSKRGTYVMRPSYSSIRGRSQPIKWPLTAQVLRENKILRLLIARVRADVEDLEMMASAATQNGVSTMGTSTP